MEVLQTFREFLVMNSQLVVMMQFQPFHCPIICVTPLVFRKCYSGYEKTSDAVNICGWRMSILKIRGEKKSLINS